ncbi:MAG: alpha/beta fold hydrolase [Anaerolineae bacterium]|nr:alpha/beta fold hydrolase [Anaerolineae bacterium]
MRHNIEGGIERISYIPKRPRFQTPILMQHGMWHGAWCWQSWQELLAQWGWASHAFSLPGHAGSPRQRPNRWCTLGYYLRFLEVEVERLPRRPVLMGHSMGGALVQWYLKYGGDDLPAAVLVAPWVSHNTYAGGLLRFLRLDPVGVLLATLTAWATPYIRTPAQAAKKLISNDALYSPEELHARLGPESALVMMQHNPPLWFPAKTVKTPLLWLAGERDAVVGEAAQRRSAAYYGADYRVVPGAAAHNLMMEHNYRQTAAMIYDWLNKCKLA